MENFQSGPKSAGKVLETDGVSYVGRRHPLEPVRNASPIVSGPMGTHQGVERLVSDALDDGVLGCLVIAALDVEVAYRGSKTKGANRATQAPDR